MLDKIHIMTDIYKPFRILNRDTWDRREYNGMLEYTLSLDEKGDILKCTYYKAPIGLRYRYSTDSLVITLNPNKLIHGTNLVDSNYLDYELVTKKIYSILGNYVENLNLDDMIVLKLEDGINLNMDYAPRMYTKFLKIHMPTKIGYYKTATYADSFQLHNNQNSLIVYDKEEEEAERVKMNFPELFDRIDTTNLIRIENRMNRSSIKSKQHFGDDIRFKYLFSYDYMKKINKIRVKKLETNILNQLSILPKERVMRFKVIKEKYKESEKCTLTYNKALICVLSTIAKELENPRSIIQEVNSLMNFFGLDIPKGTSRYYSKIISKMPVRSKKSLLLEMYKKVKLKHTKIESMYKIEENNHGFKYVDKYAPVNFDFFDKIFKGKPKKEVVNDDK